MIEVPHRDSVLYGLFPTKRKMWSSLMVWTPPFSTGLRPFARSDVADSSRVQVRPASGGCSQRTVRGPLGKTERDQRSCNVVWHHRERPTQSNSAEPLLRAAV